MYLYYGAACKHLCSRQGREARKSSKERVADQLEFASQAIEHNTEEEKKKWLQA